MNEKQLREEFNKQFCGTLAEYDTIEGAGGYDPRSYILDFLLKKIKEARLSAIQEVIDNLPDMDGNQVLFLEKLKNE